MRIIGGRFKGKRLRAPSNIPARPTTDYARESLFNILHHRVQWEATDFLDLFAGLGGISLEAVSRGAHSVVCVDQSYQAVRWLNQCADQLQIHNLSVVKSDALKWIKNNTKAFDIVFADPPYDFPNYEELILGVMTHCLRSDGFFILEHRQSVSFASHPSFKEERTYGEVRFSFFDQKP